MRAPFAPLVSGAEELAEAPSAPLALRARMAALYGVSELQVLPVRGRLHALELILRRAARNRIFSIACNPSPEIAQLAAIYGLHIATNGANIHIVSSPGDDGGTLIDRAAAQSLAADVRGGLLVVDESAIEFSCAPSLAGCADHISNLIVVRSLELAYGLAGAPVGAIVANPQLIAHLEEMLEPYALPTPLVRLAETVLAPSRAPATEARIVEITRERSRMAQALNAVADVSAQETAGPWLLVTIANSRELRSRLERFGIQAKWFSDARLSIPVADVELNNRALAAFGVESNAPRRRAEIVRDTKETRIAVRVDLDASAGSRVSTGIGFYDHMLEQVAAHGGFSLTLACDGDLQIDPHHTIEDCALALGAALKDALGERRGIARFGFVLPMDEAEAKVSLDLGARPYDFFEGAFAAPFIGEYPTEMTAHVFRSLAQSLGAAIHIQVTGSNDHHKTEACFKGFGRALRQAIRIEDTGIPSTKGVIG
jgi:imidazoleglycerol phosphate dehydratase HisB/histidinol-phosphate/aromatic aminotransferase/cobyric acid decarboxylase-like protein